MCELAPWGPLSPENKACNGPQGSGELFPVVRTAQGATQEPLAMLSWDASGNANALPMGLRHIGWCGGT